MSRHFDRKFALNVLSFYLFPCLADRLLTVMLKRKTLHGMITAKIPAIGVMTVMILGMLLISSDGTRIRQILEWVFRSGMHILNISHTMKDGADSAEVVIKRNRNCSELLNGFSKRLNNTALNLKNAKHRSTRKLTAGSARYFEFATKYWSSRELLWRGYVLSERGEEVDIYRFHFKRPPK